mmetsp:Transcript_18772/g.38881  ORF Transcript_18772/g.38881 Transcript_18772/m.38881 type:complete len:99 (+) Transcript_18772:2405-2701(+)
MRNIENDRIVPIAAALSMLRIGATPLSVHCMLSTLEQIRHYIRSSLGDSILYFDSDAHSGIPLGGVVQGNGAAQAIWALVSTPIFNAMRRRFPPFPHL